MLSSKKCVNEFIKTAHLLKKSGVTRGGRPGLWYRARSEKHEKSHTKGRKKIL